MNSEAEQEFYRRQELVVMDDEDAAKADLYRKLEDRLDRRWKSLLRLVLQYEGNRDMMLDCAAFALGFGDMIPLPLAANPKGKPVDMVMLSIKWFGNSRHKETIGKCVKTVQDSLGLPPVPGQRSEQGRKAMSGARLQQLT